MVEYIYDLIRISAGEDVIIQAKITDEDGFAITEACNFVLHQGDTMVVYDGVYENDIWSFTVPSGLSAGKYEYCLRKGEESLCFKKPFYVV